MMHNISWVFPKYKSIVYVFFYSILLVDIASAGELSTFTGAVDENGAAAAAVAACVVLLALAVSLVSCVCCRAYSSRRSDREKCCSVDQLRGVSYELSHATPSGITTTQQQQQQHCYRDDGAVSLNVGSLNQLSGTVVASGGATRPCFEPLPPLATLRAAGGAVGGATTVPPLPAVFNLCVTRGFSTKDWFDNPQCVFARSKLRYRHPLGCGWFGQAIVGEVRDGVEHDNCGQVVVKSLKSWANLSEQMFFLYEMAAWRDACHPNVLRLLGRCLETSPYLLILELHGTLDLKQFLSTRSPQQKWQLIEKTQPASGFEPSTACRLVQLACDCTAALLHLHELNYTHSDLAARNCRISDSLVVKIGDYGCSATSHPDDYYIAGDVAVPIRWMSPEILECTTSTIETKQITKCANVWSLGVLLWEMTSFGALPYWPLTDDDVICHVISERSVQLPRPKLPSPPVHCHVTSQQHSQQPCALFDKMYSVMQLCWLPAAQRVSVATVAQILSQLAAAPQFDTNFDLRWQSLRASSGSEPTCSDAPASLDAELHDALARLDSLLATSIAGSGGGGGGSSQPASLTSSLAVEGHFSRKASLTTTSSTAGDKRLATFLTLTAPLDSLDYQSLQQPLASAPAEVDSAGPAENFAAPAENFAGTAENSPDGNQATSDGVSRVCEAGVWDTAPAQDIDCSHTLLSHCADASIGDGSESVVDETRHWVLAAQELAARAEDVDPVWGSPRVSSCNTVSGHLSENCDHVCVATSAVNCRLNESSTSVAACVSSVAVKSCVSGVSSVAVESCVSGVSCAAVKSPVQSSSVIVPVSRAAITNEHGGDLSSASVSEEVSLYVSAIGSVSGSGSSPRDGTTVAGFVASTPLKPEPNCACSAAGDISSLSYTTALSSLNNMQPSCGEEGCREMDESQNISTFIGDDTPVSNLNCGGCERFNCDYTPETPSIREAEVPGDVEETSTIPSDDLDVRSSVDKCVSLPVSLESQDAVGQSVSVPLAAVGEENSAVFRRQSRQSAGDRTVITPTAVDISDDVLRQDNAASVVVSTSEQCCVAVAPPVTRRLMTEATPADSLEEAKCVMSAGEIFAEASFVADGSKCNVGGQFSEIPLASAAVVCDENTLLLDNDEEELLVIDTATHQASIITSTAALNTAAQTPSSDVEEQVNSDMRSRMTRSEASYNLSACVTGAEDIDRSLTPVEVTPASSMNVLGQGELFFNKIAASANYIPLSADRHHSQISVEEEQRLLMQVPSCDHIMTNSLTSQSSSDWSSDRVTSPTAQPISAVEACDDAVPLVDALVERSEIQAEYSDDWETDDNISSPESGKFHAPKSDKVQEQGGDCLDQTVESCQQLSYNADTKFLIRDSGECTDISGEFENDSVERAKQDEAGSDADDCSYASTTSTSSLAASEYDQCSVEESSSEASDQSSIDCPWLSLWQPSLAPTRGILKHRHCDQQGKQPVVEGRCVTFCTQSSPAVFLYPRQRSPTPPPVISHVHNNPGRQQWSYNSFQVSDVSPSWCVWELDCNNTSPYAEEEIEDSSLPEILESPDRKIPRVSGSVPSWCSSSVLTTGHYWIPSQVDSGPESLQPDFFIRREYLGADDEFEGCTSFSVEDTFGEGLSTTADVEEPSSPDSDTKLSPTPDSDTKMSPTSDADTNLHLTSSNADVVRDESPNRSSSSPEVHPHKSWSEEKVSGVEPDDDAHGKESWSADDKRRLCRERLVLPLAPVDVTVTACSVDSGYVGSCSEDKTRFVA